MKQPKKLNIMIIKKQNQNYLTFKYIKSKTSTNNQNIEDLKLKDIVGLDEMDVKVIICASYLVLTRGRKRHFVHNKTKAYEDWMSELVNYYFSIKKKRIASFSYYKKALENKLIGLLEASYQEKTDMRRANLSLFDTEEQIVENSKKLGSERALEIIQVDNTSAEKLYSNDLEYDREKADFAKLDKLLEDLKITPKQADLKGSEQQKYAEAVCKAIAITEDKYYKHPYFLSSESKELLVRIYKSLGETNIRLRKSGVAYFEGTRDFVSSYIKEGISDVKELQKILESAGLEYNKKSLEVEVDELCKELKISKERTKGANTRIPELLKEGVTSQNEIRDILNHEGIYCSNSYIYQIIKENIQKKTKKIKIIRRSRLYRTKRIEVALGNSKIRRFVEVERATTSASEQDLKFLKSEYTTKKQLATRALNLERAEKKEKRDHEQSLSKIKAEIASMLKEIEKLEEQKKPKQETLVKARVVPKKPAKITTNPKWTTFAY